jgi:Putative zinc-finger
VTDQHQREQSIERLLRQGAGRASLSADATDCLDGELLAAWSSRALPPTEMARVEAHVADCLRCQSMVAAFAQTDVATPAPVPSQSWWSLRWLVPLAAAAAVVAIWVATPTRNPVLFESSVPQPRADAEVRSPETARVLPQAGPVIGPNPAQKAQAAPPDQLADAVEKREARGRQVPQPAPRQERAPEPVSEERLAATAPSVTSPAPAPVVATAPPAQTRTLNETAAFASPPPAMARFNAASVDIRSPNGTTRWRFAAGSPLERSLDGGATWQPVELPSSAVLTAGHSPGGSVAWLVGRSGAIYLTTDGSQFESVSFVEAVDLTSVVATDDRQATVTTADGRRFTTTTRGSTWIQP